MNIHDATEAAFRRGYEIGKTDVQKIVTCHWIERLHEDTRGDYYLWHCSRCDNPSARKRNFCAECGAKMEIEGKSLMPRYISENEIYALFDKRGQASLHVGDIDVLPRVEVKEVVHGQWILRHDGYHCSNCDIQAIYTGVELKYCPNCGAKMDGGTDND